MIDTVAGPIDPWMVKNIWWDSKPKYAVHILMHDRTEVCHYTNTQPTPSTAWLLIDNIWDQIREARSATVPPMKEAT